MDAIQKTIDLYHRPKNQQSAISRHMGRTRNVIFPSSKKKRLCRVNGPGMANFSDFVLVDSTGKPHVWIDMLLVLISLGSRSLSRAVSMESEEILVDVDGDSTVSAETVGKYSFMSELLSTWLILSMLETRDVGRAARIVQGFMMDRGKPHERQFRALGQGPGQLRRGNDMCTTLLYESLLCQQ